MLKTQSIKIENLSIAVLLVVVALGVLYLLVANRQTKEGFQVELPYHQGPVDWNKGKEVLVVFSKMEGCGHCVRMAPEWKKASDKLNGKPMPNGKVCRMVVVDPNHKLSEGFRGFPTIKKYVGENQVLNLKVQELLKIQKVSINQLNNNQV